MSRQTRGEWLDQVLKEMTPGRTYTEIARMLGSSRSWVSELLSAEDAALGKRLDPAALASRHGFRDPPGVARFYSELLVQDALDRKVGASVEAAARKAPDTAASAREAATLVLTSPEYQLG